MVRLRAFDGRLRLRQGGCGVHPPGRVHEVVEVPVPRPRSEEQLFDPTFMATRRHIDGIMHPPGTQQKETPVTSTNASTSTRSSP